MTIKLLHRNFLNECRRYYNEDEAAAITSLFFEHYLKASKSAIILQPDRVISAADQEKLNACIRQLIEYKPVQYIIGECNFLNLALKVTPDVLIPRPETEELALRVIQFVQQHNCKKILDIGTGSGCLSVAIKNNVASCSVTAIDVCSKALTVAKINAEKYNAAIHFQEIDFLMESNWQLLGNYDVIVSNPPYIPVSEKEMLDKNVTAYEPHLALFTEDNRPFIFYEKIASFAQNKLVKEGKIFMEIHERYAPEIEKLLTAKGFITKTAKDIYGKDRMIEAWR